MSSKKAITQTGEGIATIIGLAFGMVLALIFYGWYLTGFADSTTVMYTAILVILLILITNWVIVIFAKKFKKDYNKGVWFGIGFIIAIIAVTLILGYIGLTSPITISSVIFGSGYLLPQQIHKMRI